MISFSIYFHFWKWKPHVIYSPEFKECIVQWLCFSADVDWCCVGNEPDTEEER